MTRRRINPTPALAMQRANRAYKKAKKQFAQAREYRARLAAAEARPVPREEELTRLRTLLRLSITLGKSYRATFKYDRRDARLARIFARIR